MPMPANTVFDFLAQVGVDVEDACWWWKGSRFNEGYGRFSVKGRGVLAHRYAWTTTFGPIPPGKFVLHRCDNKLCVNPRHLFLGDQAANMADMKRKDRSCHGTALWSAKLTPGKVRRIRRLLRDGNTQVVIAGRFGVTQHLVSMIKRGRIWVRVK